MLPQSNALAVTLVVNKNNPIDTMTLDQVRYIFLMRMKYWDDGSKIKVFVSDWDGDTHSKFTREILKVIPHRINNAWERRKYSRMGDIPETVSELKMIEALSKNINSIGYVDVFTNEMSVNLKKIKVE
jgi:ABC-type phosphate transport system substrate-binding protein